MVPDVRPAGTVRRRDVVLTTLLLAVVGALFMLYGPLNHGPARWVARTSLDEHIPLVTPLVVPYVSALALGPVTLLVFLARSVRLAQSALLAAILLLIVAYACYFFAQTHVARPVVPGDDVFARMLRGVYANDEAYNCFPSLHVGSAVIIAIHWLRLHRKAGAYVAAWCVLIIISTVFVRQHYLADVLAGLLLAGAACWAAPRLLARVIRPAQAQAPAPAPAE